MPKFFEAVRNVFKALGLDAKTAHLDEWEEVFTHWAAAMKAGYTLAATDDDREIFRVEIRWYLLKKALIKSGAMKWYDWQYWSMFPILFDKFGSLRLISQETMEGQQAILNQQLHRSNGFGNVGRRLKSAVQAGAEAVKEYMEKRKKKARGMTRWLFERLFLGFMVPVRELFERLEALKAAGKGRAYRGEPFSHAYVPACNSFTLTTSTAFKLVGRSRAAGVDRPLITALLEKVEAARQDLDEDVEKFQHMSPADRRIHLLRARKKRWKLDNGAGSGKQLLHTRAELSENGAYVLLPVFGSGGRFPMGFGRERVEEEWSP
jgi:hypothetical protein